MRQRVLYILSVVLVGAVLVVTGCSGSALPVDSQAVANEPASRLSGHVLVWSHDTSAKSLTAVLPAFNHEYSNVHVDVEMTGARMTTRFMLALAGGVGAPDVMDFFGYDAHHYIATGRLSDLTDVASKYRLDFPPSVWNACVAQGRVYAVP